jgi:hypothetical protein
MDTFDFIADVFKELADWLLVALMFAFILGVVLTGGGILSAEYWSIVFYK